MGQANATEVDRVRQQEDVRQALQQTATTKQAAVPVVEAKDKAWLGLYGLVLLVSGALYYLLRLNLFGLPLRILPLLQRFTLGIMAVVLVLGAAKFTDTYLIERIDDAVTRFNLKRIRRLLVALILTFIGISILFANWYTAVVSLGLISLILGFALQTPITSFIGWIYILVRKPYRVGDRIKIEDATGDVIDVSYLDTTLWEFGGQYLSTEHPSGRVIKFPNSEPWNPRTATAFPANFPGFAQKILLDTSRIAPYCPSVSEGWYMNRRALAQRS